MQSRVYSVENVRAQALIGIPENPPAIAVSAEGLATTTGWTHPDLTPWVYIVPPKDGILDLDFIATAPTGPVLPVLSPIAVTKAFLIPPWVLGVRIHSSTNFAEATIAGARQPTETDKKAEGWPGPWPFPWWTPKARR